MTSNDLSRRTSAGDSSLPSRYGPTGLEAGPRARGLQIANFEFQIGGIAADRSVAIPLRLRANWLGAVPDVVSDRFPPPTTDP